MVIKILENILINFTVLFIVIALYPLFPPITQCVFLIFLIGILLINSIICSIGGN